MATFSRQNDLPSLPVPSLDESLDKYLQSARALLNDSEIEKIRLEADKFKNSDLGKQLQSSLENRAKSHRNWLDEWWYDAYNEIREPLIPYVSFGAVNSMYERSSDGQLSRASDVAYHWLDVWHKIRHEKWPITQSRGVTWDMAQFYYLFNSNRTPLKPLDRIERFFRTAAESNETKHSHIVVGCNGCLWKVSVLDEKLQLKSPAEFYKIFKYIQEQSRNKQSECIVKLTTDCRDEWAMTREELMRINEENHVNLRDIESAIFFLTLADCEANGDAQELMHKCLMDKSWYTWQDKSVSLTIYKDAQVIVQGDHSNIDAIVLLQVGDYVASKVSKDSWHVDCEGQMKPSGVNELRFTMNAKISNALAHADAKYEQFKQKYRARCVLFDGYGNDKCRESRIYTDTVVQLALQLAYAKTHGFFAPIYETASTRKYYLGRTETVRGCTQQLIELAKSLIGAEKNGILHNQAQLFKNAVDAHNQLMADCMDGRGFDRHIYGLKKTLEIQNKGCGPKRALPSFLSDETWSRTGGNGNFLLSTSFIGYMPSNEHIGTFGYVAAMRPDGYGCFYRIGKQKIAIAISDWVDSRSNIDAFGENLRWALARLGQIMDEMKKSKL